MKPLPLTHEAFDAYKPAAEDWYPCFDGGRVHIHRSARHLVVTGADDTAMEKHYDDPGHLARDWEWLGGLSVVFKQDLRDRGFEP